jgi:hypothetical protein
VSRRDFRIQTYNPASFTSVLAGGNTYDPVYVEEASITNGTYEWVPQFGCPYAACTIRGIDEGSNVPRPTAVLVDNVNKKVILCFGMARPSGNEETMCTVLGRN